MLITIDENGIPVKNYHGDSEDASMHEILSQLFVNLTKLDGNNTKAIIESCLERQVSNEPTGKLMSPLPGGWNGVVVQ